MKRIQLFVLGLCFIFFIGNFTQANDYEYSNLDIQANILSDGTINVIENFTANFFVQKHGIIRTIPLNYSVKGQTFHIDISNINVQGHKFSTSKNNGEVEIKIGDPNRTIIGEQYYPISYKVYGLIRNFSGMGYAELYWNLVGYDFDTNINKVKATILLPKAYFGFTPDDFLITTDGIAKTVEEFGGTVDWEWGDRITITYDKGLSSYQGITLAIKFPNDYFTFDHRKQAKLIGYSNKTSGDFPLLECLLSLGLIGLSTFLVIRLSKHKTNSTIVRKTGALKGKFAKQFPTIIQYEPPKGLNSAEVGLLFHRKATPKDMLSLIYKRATEGLITISTGNEEKKKYMQDDDIIIIKNKDIPTEYPGYEKDFFYNLVANKENIIKKSTNIYKKLKLSSLEIYGEDKGWLINAKDSIGTIFLRILGSIFLCIFLFTLFMILMTTCNNDIIISITGVLTVFTPVIFIYSILYSLSEKRKETEEGARLISHILGYRDFLATCDENKLKLFLQQDPLYFDKILPYAIVFGLESELLKKIEPIIQELNIKHSRYNGDISIIGTINDTIESAASYSYSTSYNSSSGFSSGSSFDSDRGSSSDSGGFSSGGGGGGGGGRSR